jgi:NAD(P)-dependent dehydrogenase (short-subunit alcohol dehydrogenase family)
MGRLTGKRVLITGTGSGMGREAVRYFSEEGALVVGCDARDGTAEATAEEFQGDRTLGNTVNLANADEATQWVQQAAARLGGIDAVYNNAGSSAQGLGPVEDVTTEAWEFIIAHELSLTFWVTRAAWPFLKKQGGSIINVASVAGIQGDGFFPAGGHNAAKGGVMALTRQHAVEGGPYGIRANSISPGYIVTPQSEASVPADLAKILRDQYPLKRFGAPRDVVALAAFLASDEASWISGTNIPVDGGLTSGRPA